MKVLGSLSSATNELLQELCAKCICNLTHRTAKEGSKKLPGTASKVRHDAHGSHKHFKVASSNAAGSLADSSVNSASSNQGNHFSD